jgi:multicomponent Na+:H+ antiporter subunit B
MMMAYQDYRVSHNILMWVESLAGVTFAGIGVWGLAMGNTFLENFLPIGNLNDLLSGGIIPIIYIAVGFKVAAELTGLIYTILHEKD